MNDFPLSVLTVENKLTGFAVYQALEACMSAGALGIQNQPQAADYQPDQPQKACIEFDLALGENMPKGCWEYYAEVTIDPTVPFWSQLASLTHREAPCAAFKGQVDITETTYRMTLRALCNTLPQLRDHAEKILPCLPVAEMNDYTLKADA
jgi:hypothetical protein